MKAKDVRSLLKSQPFAPFRVHLSDGRAFNVPHRDFALGGRDLLVVANEWADGLPGDVNMIPYDRIERAEIMPR